MPIIFTTKISEGVEEVNRYHNFPEMLPQSAKNGGILVSEIPEPLIIAGKRSILLRNATTGDLYYEYVDRELTAEEEMQQLKSELALTKTAIDDIIMGGMM